MRICDFCQTETDYFPLYAGETQSSRRALPVFWCVKCQAEYVPWGDIESRHLYVEINGKMYRWSLPFGRGMGNLFSIGEPGIPGFKANKKMQLIKSFPKDIPDITPQNIKEKVKLILLYM